MKDQAAGLRKLMERRAKGIDLEFQNIVHTLFPAGRKTAVFLGSEQDLLSLSVLTANCAVATRRTGRRVFLWEAYEHRFNTSVLLGSQAPLTLADLATGGASFSDIVYRSAQGVDLIRGIDALEKVNSWPVQERSSFFQNMRSFLEQENDCVLINELKPVFSLLMDRVVLVFSPDRESVISAYAKLKKIVAAEAVPRISCMVINAGKEKAAKAAEQFISTAGDFLKIKISFLGDFSLNGEVIQSIKKKEPFVDMYRYSAGARAIRELVPRLWQEQTEEAVQGK